MRNRITQTGAVDKVLLAFGLALSAFGIVLVSLGHKDSLLVTMLGLVLSLFSYFGLRIAQLCSRLDLGSSVAVITDEKDNFARSRKLVSRLEQGGRIFATSTFLGGDADVTNRYRQLVNRAMARNVRYQKVICFSAIPDVDRMELWEMEVADKLKFMTENRLPRDVFDLLHYPGMIHIDVLISQSRSNEPLEMVVGFTGKGRRGGFHTSDKQLISDWLLYYMEEIAALARAHTNEVLSGSQKCPCERLIKKCQEYGSARQP